jgi:hypothetical protein
LNSLKVFVCGTEQRKVAKKSKMFQIGASVITSNCLYIHM